MMNEKRIPEIRFKGFSGEWKLKKLERVVNLENGFAFKSKYFQVEPTDMVVLTPGSVNIGGGFQSGKGHFYNVKGTFPNKFIFKPDDMFVTMTDLTPTAQALGFPAVVPKDDKTYLHNQRLGKLTGFEGDKFFLFQLLSTEINQKKIVLTSSGTTVKHTSPQKFLDCENYFPLKNEQTKIGSYFQQIDALISLHQQKYDKLLNVKKAMLEKMFPKKGADVPEIRFKGFSEKWEEKRLENVATIKTGYPFDSNGFDENGDYLVITNGNIQNDSDTVVSSLGNRINIDKNSIFSEYVLHSNDILVTMDGTVGRVAKVVEKKQVLAQRVGRLTAKIAPEFLYYFLSTGSFFKEMATISHGGTIKHISLTEISNYESCIPLLIEEQTKIGNFFKKLDTLLTLQKSELEKLKNIKKACLEKMFA